MKSIRIAAAALIAAGIAAPTIASATPASTTSNATTTADNNSRASDNQRVCVRIQLTGSRIERMQCQTRAQWLQREGAVPGEER